MSVTGADVERYGLVMGTESHVRVLAPDAAAHVDNAEARLDELESRWSRFRPDSDLSRVNDAAGRPVPVSSETADLVELAVDAWRVTDGRFDPTVLPALVAAGYDRSFEEIVADGPGPVGAPAPAAGGEGVVVDHRARTVAMPAGVQLDLGGIGKGRAADLVATELLEAGADGACVNLGGDVRLVGEPPGGTGWLVGIEHPLDGDLIVTLALREGAVATSTTAHRRWADDAHHIIDPATGRPARSDLVSVTIVAGEAAWAEVVAKAALLAGFDAAPALVERLGLTGIVVDTYGKAWSLPGLEAYAA